MPIFPSRNGGQPQATPRDGAAKNPPGQTTGTVRPFIPPYIERATARLMELLRGGKAAPPAVGSTTTPNEERPELGWGGTQVFGGVVLDDYNAGLRGKDAIQTADKMRRTTGQVRAVISAVGLPIRSTAWFVEEPDQAGAAEKEAAELLRENLFGGMDGSFDDLLREAVLGTYFGFRVPEIIWEERKGLIAVRKIASRNPELAERWLFDDAGQLVGYIYAGNRPVGAGLENIYSASITRYERVAIPIEKTLHFCYEQEDENPQGFGLWRSMYPHWYFIQALYKIMGIGLERNLLGVPVARAGENAQLDDRGALLQDLSYLRAAQDSAVYLPFGWELEWFEGKRNLMDAMPFVYHHDAKIAQVALAQFLNLGQMEVGTQAVGTVQAKLFETSEDATARWIEQTLNQQLVRRWCLLNYGEKLRPPAVRHKPIRSVDLGIWAQALTQLVTGGWVHPLPQDEDQIRDELELSPIPDEQKAALAAAAASTPEAEAEPDGTDGGEPGAQDDGGDAGSGAGD